MHPRQWYVVPNTTRPLETKLFIASRTRVVSKLTLSLAAMALCEGRGLRALGAAAAMVSVARHKTTLKNETPQRLWNITNV